MAPDGAAHPIAVRRVVTGRRATASTIVDDRVVEARTIASPSRRILELWPPVECADVPPSIDLAPGEVRWMVIEFPPSGDAPAQMHSSPTIDLLLVLRGEVTAVMEEGETTLRAGDALVQTGTVHAWRNDGETPCVVSVVLVGQSS